MTTKQLVQKATESWNKYASVDMNGSTVSCTEKNGRVSFCINGEKSTRKSVEALLGK